MRTTTFVVAALLNTLMLTSHSTGDSGISPTIPSLDARVAAVPFVPSPRLIGDLNADGFVDASDLALLLASWGRCGAIHSATVEGTCSADLTNDEQVNIDDLVILLGNWS